MNFQHKQHEFTAHIRNPKIHPAPADVKLDRMAMYRSLLFNNIESFLASNFPVLKKIIPEQHWMDMAQDFFSKHSNQSPYFAEIAEEFLKYLQNERIPSPADPPFMLELAHYEWVEMAATIATEQLPGSTFDPESLNENTQIKLSALAWPLAYQFPVHRLSPQFQPDTTPDQPTFLTVFRDRNDEVRFLEIPPITYQMLVGVEENESLTLTDCIVQLKSTFAEINTDIIKSGTTKTIKELAKKDIIFFD